MEGNGNNWLKQAQQNLVAEFKSHLHAVNRSLFTIKTYANELSLFFRYLHHHRIRDLGLVVWQDIEAYQAWLVSMGRYSDATLQVKLRCLKRFYEFLLKTGRIHSNPTTFVLFPRISHLPRNVLTIKEAETLLAQPDANTDEGVKWRAILETFYSTGIRLGELCKLSLHDVDTAKGILTVRGGKGNQDATVPIGHKACIWIRTYVQTVRVKRLLDRNERRLFLGARGKPVNPQIVERQVKAFGKQAGISKAVTPHVLRHSFATHMVANGADIFLVQQLLRHKRIETSQTYIRVVQADVRKMQEDFHPRERHED